MDVENTLEHDIADIQESAKSLEGERRFSEKIQKLIDANKITI